MNEKRVKAEDILSIDFSDFENSPKEVKKLMFNQRLDWIDDVFELMISIKNEFEANKCTKEGFVYQLDYYIAKIKIILGLYKGDE